MSRLIFDLMPEEMPQKSRRVLDAAFRSIRNVLDVGIRMREQFRCVDAVIDTAAFPTSIRVPGLRTAPLGVLLLRATEQRSSSGHVISSAGVLWEWRGGALLIQSIDILSSATRYDVTLAVLE
jgi:hypothetical protein